MPTLDLGLIQIAFLRVFVVFYVLLTLVATQPARETAGLIGWSIARGRAISAFGWAIAVFLVAAFVSGLSWLGLASLGIAFIWFFVPSPIILAVARRRGVVPSGTPPDERTPDAAAPRWQLDAWLALCAGIAIGASAFYGRPPVVGAAMLLLGWLAMRRPRPVAWISLAGYAGGVSAGGVVTDDPAPLTVGLIAVVALLAAVGLWRSTRRAEIDVVAQTGSS